jgi:hypothetical protein
VILSANANVCIRSLCQPRHTGKGDDQLTQFAGFRLARDVLCGTISGPRSPASPRRERPDRSVTDGEHRDCSRPPGPANSNPSHLAIRFQQPRLATLVSRKLIEAPILTLASPSYVERYGKPEQPSAVSRHRCLLFLNPYTGRPYEWVFIREGETIEVPTSGPLTFTDPKAMLEECLAGTGITQIIGWGLNDLLARGALIDLFPQGHGERFPLFAFYPSRKHPPAKVRAFIEFCLEVVQRL